MEGLGQKPSLELQKQQLPQGCILDHLNKDNKEVPVLPLTFLLPCPPTTSPKKSRRLLKGPCLHLLLLEMGPCLPCGMKSPQSACVFRGTPQPYTTNSSAQHLWPVWEFGKFSCSYCPVPGALMGMSLLHVPSFPWALAVLWLRQDSLPCGQSTLVVL